ncbi:hypothetical protein BpHYR1_002209 [Brachionus plicatilis]|uniref:Uncharacterized protein n=1 Tax=Brachionus plicatilis TaxID=10195 RepID=A0A3M7R2B9_BRAPC|nr:hypothetical protein BpHYR1_002209 [Brachionus plicatilis]
MLLRAASYIAQIKKLIKIFCSICYFENFGKKADGYTMEIFSLAFKETIRPVRRENYNIS